MRAFVFALPLFALATSASADTSVGTTAGRRASFRVEHVKIDETANDETIWLVSTRDPSLRARLPEVALPEEGADMTSGNTSYLSDVFVSPDERFLFRDQKLFHGGNAAYLYTRVRGLVYRPAAPARLDLAVKRFFAASVGGSEDTDAMGIVELVAWGDDGASAILNLRGREIAGDYEVFDWRCTIDLPSGRVHVTRAQAEANAGTFTRCRTPARAPARSRRRSP
ncbi:MAG TPA: hypothetical protein VGL86_33345 [Polyangia bacterium]|jgi:hypothetical protein